MWLGWGGIRVAGFQPATPLLYIFSMISSTLYFLLIQLNYHFPYPLSKSDWFAGENS